MWRINVVFWALLYSIFYSAECLTEIMPVGRNDLFTHELDGLQIRPEDRMHSIKDTSYTNQSIVYENVANNPEQTGSSTVYSRYGSNEETQPFWSQVFIREEKDTNQPKPGDIQKPLDVPEKKKISALQGSVNEDDDNSKSKNNENSRKDNPEESKIIKKKYKKNTQSKTKSSVRESDTSDRKQDDDDSEKSESECELNAYIIITSPNGRRETGVVGGKMKFSWRFHPDTNTDKYPSKAIYLAAANLSVRNPKTSDFDWKVVADIDKNDTEYDFTIPEYWRPGTYKFLLFVDGVSSIISRKRICYTKGFPAEMVTRPIKIISRSKIEGYVGTSRDVKIGRHPPSSALSNTSKTKLSSILLIALLAYLA